MDLTGRKLGKYELVERLGRGGMAEVYKAFQPGVERFVVIKVLHSHLLDSANLSARFKREARAIGQLQHNHIVRVIDFDIEEEMQYLVMEYIQGGTLREYLQEKKIFSSEEALTIASQLAGALDYAHHQGMIHRDIKPANVMFMDENHTHAVLTDFGVARLLDDVTLTMSGAIVGTPAYMAPEVVRSETYDGRADIYSLGAMLYEMVTGKMLYSGDTPFAVMMKHATEPLTPPREVKPDMDEAVEKLLLKALAKNPEDRFQSAAEMQAAIQQTMDALRGGATTAVPATLSPSSSTKVTPAADDEEKGDEGLKRWLPAAGIIGGIALVVIIAVLVITNLDNGDGSQQAAGLVTEETPATEAAELLPPPTETAVPPTPDPTQPPPPPTDPPPPPTETPEPTAVPVPMPVGSLHFSDNPAARAGDFVLEVAPVRLPPAGMHYELWLIENDGETLRNLGPLPVENGRITAAGSTEENLLGNYTGALITEEPDEDPEPDTPGDIIFASESTSEQRALLRELLFVSELDEQGFLPGAESQINIAQDHAGFIQESLAQNNLDAARLHAEHVINTLDGESGDNFGDLNQDGQAQNPGNGVGVRLYLQEAGNRIQHIMETVPLAEKRRFYGEKSLAAIDNAQALSNEAQETALRILAVDTTEEAQPIVEELAILLAQALEGVDANEDGIIDPQANEGGIRAAYEQGLYLAGMGFFTPDPQLARATAFAPRWHGTFRLADGEAGPASEFILEMERVPLLPENAHYELRTIGNEGEVRLNLGELPVEDHRIRFAGTADENLLAHNRGVEIIVVREGEEEEVRPVFTGALPPPFLDHVRQILIEAPEREMGFLAAAEDQAALAIQHSGFAHDALLANDLENARRHVEHVVNILDGNDPENPEADDLDGDGQGQNPGDGFGVLAHLEGIRQQIGPVIESMPPNGRLDFHAALLDTTTTHSLEIANAAIDKAIQVLSTDTVEEAQPFAEELNAILASLLEGQDLDENGVIDPLAGEGSILATRRLVYKFSEIGLTPVE